MYVFYASSDKYASYLGVSILSLLENNQDLKTIEIFVCDDGISTENKEKLKQVTDKYKRSIAFLDYRILQNVAQRLNWKEQGGSYSTYSKILVGEYLPEYVDRVLYIDSSDTLIVGSLRDLETMDMGNHAFAARVAVSFHVTGNSIPSYDFIVAKEKTYYNCGVFLINMKTWRERKCFEIICEKAKSEPHFDIYDQTVINTYLPQDYGMILPLKYNFNGYIYANYLEEKKLSIGRFYSSSEIKEASKKPVIIHWPGGIHHPYVKGGLCRKKQLYRRYMKLSPWDGEFDTPNIFSKLPASKGRKFRLFYKYYPMIEFYTPRLSQLMYKVFKAASK